MCALCGALQVTGATFDKGTGLWTVTAASGQHAKPGTSQPTAVQTHAATVNAIPTEPPLELLSRVDPVDELPANQGDLQHTFSVL
jgi:hypothetical protein